VLPIICAYLSAKTTMKGANFTGSRFEGELSPLSTKYYVGTRYWPYQIMKHSIFSKTKTPAGSMARIDVRLQQVGSGALP